VPKVKKGAAEEGAQFVRFFGPLLDALRGPGGSGTPDEVVERIAVDLNASENVQNELLPSGEPRFRNQVAWARFHLVREGFLDSSRRGIWSFVAVIGNVWDVPDFRRFARNGFSTTRALVSEKLLRARRPRSRQKPNSSIQVL
jgi:restriction endonuclease Mrr